MTLAEVKATLQAAVLAARAAGKKIIQGSFGDSDMGTCCLISALVPNKPGHAIETMRRAAQELGLTDPQVWAVIEGFDNVTTTTGGVEGYWRVGREIATELGLK